MSNEQRAMSKGQWARTREYLTSLVIHILMIFLLFWFIQTQKNNQIMKRRNFIQNAGIAALAGGGMVTAAGCDSQRNSTLGSSQIQHGVIFTLKYEKGSPEANLFLEDGRRILTGIPVVQNFQVYDQVSKKNDFQYGFTMVFDNMEDYTTYNEHPDHVAFVEERWMKEVVDFLEIDFRGQ